MIDYIVKITGREKMFYVGHSQGTTAFFVMSVERPEYQAKIQAMFALAPVAYCGRMNNPIFQILARFTGTIYVCNFNLDKKIIAIFYFFFNGLNISLQELMKLIGKHEFKPIGKILKMFKEVACTEDAITQPLCANLLFLFGGFNKDQFNAVRYCL